MDNPRLWGWRLILEPGQSTPAMRQSAPGVRIVVQGGEVEETNADQRRHTLNLRFGDYMWQNAGSSRALQNTGNTRVELVEFEVT
jgi:hypothetical protein